MNVITNTSILSMLDILALNKSTNAISKSLERLSTGCRINSSKDDASGSAISVSLSNKISSYNVVDHNAQTAQAMINTANGALVNIQDILIRIRDLSQQSLNGTYSLEERQVMQDEANNLIEEMYRVKSTTTFSNKQILGEEAFSTLAEGKKINDELEAEEQAKIRAKEAQKAREKELIDQEYIAVYTAQQLQEVLQSDLNCKVVLCADINLNDLTADATGSNWTRIGTSSNSFKGTLDGNGHTISNLKINKPSSSCQGLFGATDGATIQNLNLENVDIKGKDYTGGLVGLNYDGSTITNCTSSCNVTGYGERIGGFVGSNYYNSAIEGSATDSKVTAGESATNIGAFVGYAYGTISNNEYNPTVNVGMSPFGSGSVTEEKITANPNLHLNKKVEPKEYKDSKVSLQVGIDSSDSSVIEVDTGVELGYLDIDITTVEGAKKALNRVDSMLDKVISKQGELGAVLNRLDSVIQYQTTEKIALNEAHSIIKDTDFAQETSALV